MRQHVQPFRRRKFTKLLGHQVDTVLLHFPSDFPSLHCLLVLFVLHTHYTLERFLMRASMKYYMETMRLSRVQLKIPFSASPVCKHVHLY
jgi:hypothetical protein